MGKKSIVFDLITKGKQLMENPDKPKFLDGHVGRIKDGWMRPKTKLLLVWNFCTTPKLPGKALLLDSRKLLLISRREKRKSRRSRNVSTLPLLKMIWPRGNRSSLIPRTLLRACLLLSKTTMMS